MSYEQERIDIESRLSTNWTTTPIAWDNVAYIPTPGTAWIRCTILPGSAEGLAFGKDTEVEYPGIIDIGIFTPKDTGSAAGRGYADTLAALFHLEDFGTVECEEASMQNLGIDEDWLHLSITIPFKRRE